MIESKLELIDENTVHWHKRLNLKLFYIYLGFKEYSFRELVRPYANVPIDGCISTKIPHETKQGFWVNSRGDAVESKELSQIKKGYWKVEALRQ